MSFIQFSKNKFRKRKKIIQKIVLLFFVVSAILILFSIFSDNKIIIDEKKYYPKEVLNIDYDFNGEMYFNDSDGYETYSKVVVEALEFAQKSIQIAMYSINDSEIVDILKRKKTEGVNIEIVVPKSKEKQHAFVFALSGLDIIEVGVSSENDAITDDTSRDTLMHNKFIILDAGEPNQKLLFGSSNLTLLQIKYDSNFLISTNDSSLINVFKEEFDLLKKKKFGLKKLRSGNFKPLALVTTYTNGFIETWFGPGYMKNSIKTKIIDEINNAEESIKIIGWRINDRDIYKALRKKAIEGVRVQLIIDDFYMWDEISITNKLNDNAGQNLQIFSDSYMHVLFVKKGIGVEDNLDKKFNSFLHHHALIVDDNLLVTGSNNWSQGGFYYNDESAIVTDVEKIVKKYIFQFNYLYTLLHGEKIDTEINSENILKIESEIDSESKIIIYVEKSDPNWTGDICFEMSYKEYKQQNKIPVECVTETTRIFVTDEDYNLIASDYLEKQ